MLRRIARCALCLLLLASAMGLAGEPIAEPIAIRFDQWTPQGGLTLSITVPGDRDGVTSFSNKTCCGIADARVFVRDVEVRSSGHPLAVEVTATGWTVRHRRGASLTVTYRLPPSGPLRIDSGTQGQFQPLVDSRTFHLIGTTALVLPTGRAGSDPVTLEIDATRVASHGRFVSSFGAGNSPTGIRTTRANVASALYLGGALELTTHENGGETVAVAYTGMQPSPHQAELTGDAFKIIETERRFFGDAQPWYLVSVRGAERNHSNINLGGGMGMTNAFAMFAASDLDASNPEHREQFRWVIAHEYFHQWNGRQLQVASLPGSEDDDASVYWFSEGVTDFYATRLLTRAGLLSPGAALDTLNRKLLRYATNTKRNISARDAGPLFWTDAEAEQIPYLRGYLVAWYAELAAARQSDGRRGLDDAMKALVKRAKAEPTFRVDNVFLADYLSHGLAAKEAEILHRFIINGGEVPLSTDSFRPCLAGAMEKQEAATPVLQFAFAGPDTTCFHH
jgi:predicted metalloprotease with PDZ domain